MLAKKIKKKYSFIWNIRLFILYSYHKPIKIYPMNNYRDIEEIKDFIEGMTHSIERGTQEMIDEGKNIPDVVLYLIKKPNNEGGANYGVGGGAVPSDKIGKMLHNKVVPLIMKQEGLSILCTMESVFSNGVMKVKFTNELTDEVTHTEFNYNKPHQISDLMKNLCMN
jgi:hypothetical protein